MASAQAKAGVAKIEKSRKCLRLNLLSVIRNPGEDVTIIWPDKQYLPPFIGASGRCFSEHVLKLDGCVELGKIYRQRTVFLLDSSSAKVGEPGSAGFFIPPMGKVKMI